MSLNNEIDNITKKLKDIKITDITPQLIERLDTLRLLCIDIGRVGSLKLRKRMYVLEKDDKQKRIKN